MRQRGDWESQVIDEMAVDIYLRSRNMVLRSGACAALLCSP